MKHTLLTLALSLSVLALTNCATSVGEGDDGGETDGAKTDSSNKDSSTNKDAKAGQCVSSCTSDLDCQDSCPNVPNGVNCCDTSTGICYAYSSTVCPAPVGDAGFD